MLIKLGEGIHLSCFRELYELVYTMLKKTRQDNITMVLGPVTSQNKDTFEDNLQILSSHARTLSERGWTVFDLPSCQPIIDILLIKNDVQGYPHIILEEFTIPLIKSRIFKTIFVRENYQKSIGATIEHDIALGNDIKVQYLP